MGQKQTRLLNNCLSTQRRPHAIPGAMPCALLSFTNNIIDKEYNESYHQNNQSYSKTIQSYYQDNQSYWKTIESYQSYNPMLLEVPKELLLAWDSNEAVWSLSNSFIPIHICLPQGRSFFEERVKM